MVAMAIEPPATQPDKPDQHTPQTARELFDALPPLPGFRVEVIDGKLIVSPAGSPEHTWQALDLHNALLPLSLDRGWRSTPGSLSLCIEGPRDSVIPDYSLIPPDCPRWGNEFLSSWVIMAAEVISPSSIRTDREDKLRLYALGKVPIYLLIDTITSSPGATVHSDLDEGRYRATTTVPLGKPLHLPSPIDFDLDTSIFMA
ncbi:Uma2 family endonuclease [Nonomuraea sp. NPDC050404]|uniref:Uma2 family endonuclease n=1 Tax=Nonomuraea sp. NPDC050404 TaxID=3155783 RepID=UPI0034116449